MNNLNTKQLLRFLFFLFPLVVLIASYFVFDKKSISILCNVEFVLILCALLINKTRIMSFSFFFMCLLFLFHCGYCVLWAVEYPFNESVPNRIDIETWIATIRLSMWFLFLCSAGIAFSNFKANKKTNSLNNMISKDTIKKIGLIFVCIFLLPRIYIDIRYLMAGYINAFKLDINGFVEVFAEGFYIGLLLLLVGNSSDQKKCRLILIIGLLFCVFGMMSGRRQEKVAYVVALIFFYFSSKKTKKFSLIKGTVIFLVCYLLLAFIATFGDLRHISSPSIDSFFNVFIRNLGYEMLFEQIEEFGYASYTFAATIKCFSSTGTGFGKNYFLTFLEVFPQVGGLSEITSNLSYVKQIPTEYYYWLGGSILGELYYNFGKYCIIAFFPIGCLVGGISNQIALSLNNRSVTKKTILYIISVGPMLLWIRGSFSYLPRTIIWLTVLAMFLSKMSHFRKNGYNEKNVWC